MRIKSGSEDSRTMEAIALGRKTDEMIREAHRLNGKNLMRTARMFGLSEAEIGYIVHRPDKRIAAGYWK